MSLLPNKRAARGRNGAPAPGIVDYFQGTHDARPRHARNAAGAAGAAEDGADDDDDGVFTHVLTTASKARGRGRPAGVPASVFEVAKMARPKRRPPSTIDPDAVVFHTGTPPLAERDCGASRFRRLLERFDSGTWCDLTQHQARRLRMVAIAAGITLTMRNLGDGRFRVWRLDRPYVKPGARGAKKASTP